MSVKFCFYINSKQLLRKLQKILGGYFLPHPVDLFASCDKGQVCDITATSGMTNYRAGPPTCGHVINKKNCAEKNRRGPAINSTVLWQNSENATITRQQMQQITEKTSQIA